MNGWQLVKSSRRHRPPRAPQTIAASPEAVAEMRTLSRRMNALPNELIDHIISELDDDALLVVASEPEHTNPWHSNACRQACERYRRGSHCVYPHRLLPDEPTARSAMWPILYREQCALRSALGQQAPKPSDPGLTVHIGLQLTYLLPLYGAHLIVRERVLIGPWLGRLEAEGFMPQGAPRPSNQALLLLSLMPDAVRNSRLYHMQVGGALMLNRQGSQACRAYARALQASEKATVQLGFFEAPTLSAHDVVQHMMTSAVACHDAVVWDHAMQMPQAPQCLEVSRAALLQVAAQLGDCAMTQRVLAGLAPV